LNVLQHSILKIIFLEVGKVNTANISRQNPIKIDLVDLLKRTSEIKNLRTITESPIVKSQLFDIHRRASIDQKGRESLTQLSNKFRKTVKEEIDSKGLSKNTRWWDSYQHILRAEVKHRRNLSVGSPPKTAVSFQLIWNSLIHAIPSGLVKESLVFRSLKITKNSLNRSGLK
jgi:hypothetical protein